MGMLLYIEDLLVVLPKAPQQPIGKAPIPISKIQVRVLQGKTPMNTILMLGYCVREMVSQEILHRYGSCMSIKMSIFCLLRTKFEVEVLNGDGEERRRE